MKNNFFEVAREFVDLERKHGVRAVFDPCSLADELGLIESKDNDCIGCPLYSEDGCHLSLIGIEEGSMFPDKDTL
jgi:hypothetical protein